MAEISALHLAPDQKDIGKVIKALLDDYERQTELNSLSNTFSDLCVR